MEWIQVMWCQQLITHSRTFSVKLWYDLVNIGHIVRNDCPHFIKTTLSKQIVIENCKRFYLSWNKFFERDFSIPFHNRFDLLSSDAVACQGKLNEPFRCIVCQNCLEIPLSNCWYLFSFEIIKVCVKQLKRKQ